MSAEVHFIERSAEIERYVASELDKISQVLPPIMAGCAILGLGFISAVGNVAVALGRVADELYMVRRDIQGSR